MLQDIRFSVETAAQEVDTPFNLPTALAEPQLKRVAVMGNFPPRQCGLATFTRDVYHCLYDHLPLARFDVIAMDDHAGPYDYPPEVTHKIPQDDVEAYRQLARELNAAQTQVLYVQHEFGIFGGPAGAHLLQCLERVNFPVVTTLHTVLEKPTPEQRHVMEGLIRCSSTLITMAHKGAELLKKVYGVPDAQILVTPHGAPSRPLRPTAEFKAALGAEGRNVLSTFGLLAPNKGIETLIEALPAIVKASPDVLYFVVGATHPNLILNEGEAYRESLMERARALGVDQHVRFINRFMSDEELIDVLQATDIYITPYLTETQITSGTLSYALALGKPVVSAPYWHAVEALADGVGILCPFRSSEAFAEAVIDLLTNESRRRHMSQRAYLSALPSRWDAIATAYVTRARHDIMQFNPRPEPVTDLSAMVGPSPEWTAILRMSDDCGLFQHGRYRMPDRRHGYCTDDNARALMLMARRAGLEPLSEAQLALTYRYAAFVDHAWNAGTGRFRNFMSFARQWLDEGGSNDCCARAIESLCETAASEGLPADLRHWADQLLHQAAPHIEQWTSQRTRAILIRALDVYGRPDPAEQTRLMTELSAPLVAGYRHHNEAHSWFEPDLSYDNARLAEGLLIAAHHLRDAQMQTDALSALRHIMACQTAPEGHFRPITTRAFAAGQTLTDDHTALFDQQPLEAQAATEACLRAWRLTGDAGWRAEAAKAYGWFTGRNDHHLSLFTEDGGCFDGLTVGGVNENQGAESILARHLSWCALKSAER